MFWLLVSLGILKIHQMKVVWIYNLHHLCSEQNNGHLYEIHPINR
jgi:hypothetical protein